ncbi:unnamed protein product, partial [Mesorhabditis belari]|uniref:Uncharacterized protein n=1 Tax=Mesorhabditis belari TaxID=2138241 RepID=A0AAF3F2J8_9BILA
MARMYKNEILALHFNMNSAFPSGIDRFSARLRQNCLNFNYQHILIMKIRKHSFNLQYRRKHPDGGHFAAYKLPKTLAGDIFEFIRQQTISKPKKTDEL